MKKMITEQIKNYRKNWRYRLHQIKNEEGSQFTHYDYNRLFQIQGGRCAGCHRHQSELKKSLSLDHNHRTNFARGLLCSNCNFIIGHAKDNPDQLITWSKYLQENQ